MTAMGNDFRIGLALSGGGVRAMGFHLGVLGRLAEEERLEAVTLLSTVSGGSLAVALVYALSGNRWPTSREYLDRVWPEARRRLTGFDIQREVTLRSLERPWLLIEGRASVVAECIGRRWGVTGLLKDLPREPRWIINATTFESGKNWRFMPQRMGDYLLGYVPDPPVPIAQAVAASAAFPGLIGPLVLHTGEYTWVRYKPGSRSQTESIHPPHRRLHLWDGGVYDNQGIEALFKLEGSQLREGYDFLIVSDASSPFDTSVPILIRNRARRVIDIATGQVRSLRVRALMEHFRRSPGSGVYLQLGNTAHFVLQEAGISDEDMTPMGAGCLADSEVRAITRLRTSLRRLSKELFEGLYRHGWEVADCTLASRRPDIFHSLSASREDRADG